MLCEPAVRLTLRLAMSEFSGAGAPSAVAPSKKVNVPVGTAVTPLTLEPLTVALKVTGVPATEGLAEEVATVVSALLFSNTLTPEKPLPSPELITSIAPSPLTSAKAMPNGSRLGTYSSGS